MQTEPAKSARDDLPFDSGRDLVTEVISSVCKRGSYFRTCGVGQRVCSYACTTYETGGRGRFDFARRRTHPPTLRRSPPREAVRGCTVLSRGIRRQSAVIRSSLLGCAVCERRSGERDTAPLANEIVKAWNVGVSIRSVLVNPSRPPCAQVEVAPGPRSEVSFSKFRTASVAPGDDWTSCTVTTSSSSRPRREGAADDTGLRRKARNLY